MWIEILKYSFLGIFLATAIIGILSLPGWIKLDEWYRKKIFIALILEVIGAIIILFNQEVITSGPSGTPSFTVTDQEWVALNDSAHVIQPEVVITTNDTMMVRELGKESLPAFKGLTLQLSGKDLRINNSLNHKLASVELESLAEYGLFNSFKTAKDEITSTENYSYVKWNKSLGGRWWKKGSFLGPFKIKVDDYSGGTYYQIINIETGENCFDSRNQSRNLFSVDNRIIHFYKYKNVYYLLRIAWANLESSNKYIHIVNVRMQPVLDPSQQFTTTNVSTPSKPSPTDN